ncbi:RidA family protein [Kocuria rosea]|uniref:RidA family protein n=1 Tax=Kocuria rosea TaxID=1275 RepID=UPI002542311A|nr:Rid family hydrolase [Kocuria rosea]WIG18793.1 Rid family hydrolase [Kocuria rosea]
MWQEPSCQSIDGNAVSTLDKAMEPQAFFSNELHQSTAPFSHLVRAGDLGFVSGIIGQNRDDGALVSDDVTAQCEAMFDNMQTLLGEVGLGFQHLLRTTLYLKDYDDFGALNAVYGRRLNTPYPARTTVQVAALPLGAAVQVDAVVAFR